MTPERGGEAIKVHVSQRQRALKVPAALMRRAATAAAGYAKGPRGPLGVVVIGDAEMRELNLRFARVIGTTDVLAFDLSDEAAPDEAAVRGEVVVNAGEAIAQARRRRKDAVDELVLYVVHGVLHLAGYRDHTAAQKRRMRAAEAAVMKGLAGRAKRVK